MYIFVLRSLCFLMLKICYIPFFVWLFIILYFCWTLFSFLWVFVLFFEQNHNFVCLRTISSSTKSVKSCANSVKSCVIFIFLCWNFIFLCVIFCYFLQNFPLLVGFFVFLVFLFFEHCSVFYDFLLFLLNIVHLLEGFFICNGSISSVFFFICNCTFSTVLYSFKSKIYSNTKLGVMFLPHYTIRRCFTDDFYRKGN